MTTMKSNFVQRVQRLPKPTKTSEALIPLFEAVSNSIHSVQERHKAATSRRGVISVQIDRPKGRRPLEITVSDNGVGLNEKNYEAFTTTDTDNKIEIGGKGVGRLLWLDCFQNVSVESTYVGANKKPRHRKFDFRLSNADQILNEDDRAVRAAAYETGVKVSFRGLRDNGYKDKFPTRLAYVFQHITSQFLPTFIGGKSPKIIVTCGDETREYPEEIENYIHRKLEVPEVNGGAFGEFKMILMECSKVASSDLDGRHFIHFIAHDRTVKSQRIDGKLGIKYFGPEGDRVFHACLFGAFLNKNVNQERTKFTFEDSVIEEIVNDVCMPHVQEFLKEPLGRHRGEQQSQISSVVASYPAVSFGNVAELQKYIPLGELEEDAIYGHLSRERFRRNEKQAEKLRHVFGQLKDGQVNQGVLEKALAEASETIASEEKKSLAEYVVRRKVVLDFVELLLKKVRAKESGTSYQPESLLHSFICPMQVATVGKDKDVQPASHDLWILDERLTFAQYFSSDVSFEKLVGSAGSKERPDVIVFDHVHGLRQEPAMSKVLLVEFKKPGRKDYEPDENPQAQVERYVRRLLEGGLTDVEGRPINISKDTIFCCYIVADRVGKMLDWTFTWSRTADGRGRYYQPREGFNGFIELVGWDELLADAKERNKAFFDYAGIAGGNLLAPKKNLRKGRAA